MNKQQRETLMAVDRKMYNVIQRDINRQPKAIRILNSILNMLWRGVSMLAITMSGVYILTEVVGRIEYLVEGDVWSVVSYYIIVWSLLISTFVFAMRQLLVSKDIIHIEVKVKKEVSK